MTQSSWLQQPLAASPSPGLVDLETAQLTCDILSPKGHLDSDFSHGVMLLSPFLKMFGSLDDSDPHYLPWQKNFPTYKCVLSLNLIFFGDFFFWIPKRPRNEAGILSGICVFFFFKYMWIKQPIG